MITEKEKELKPCPFCGSTNIVVEDDERYPCVQCCDCNTSTDASPSKEEAVKWWNHRAAPQWSTEPPTEEGLYIIYWHKSATYTIHTLHKDRFGLSICDNNSRTRLSLSTFQDAFDKPHSWMRLATPPLPTEGRAE